MPSHLQTTFFTLLWFCIVTNHVGSAQKALDPYELMKLPRTNNLCPQFPSAIMDDQARNLILDIHNRRRRLAAQGLVKNGLNAYNTPKGSNILEMQYKCDVEESAQAYANQCPTQRSPEAQRPLYGENFYAVQEQIVPVLAVSRAGDAWWGEISNNGINQKMLFNQFFASKTNSPLSYTQMVWAESYKIGCGIGNCDPRTVVVCRYTPKGNNIGQNVYKIGEPCTVCTLGCSVAGLLCESPTTP